MLGPVRLLFLSIHAAFVIQGNDLVPSSGARWT